jgi:hypothetical protein
MGPLLLVALAAQTFVTLPDALRHSPSAEKHQIETMPGGVAVLDYDNDGRLDIFTVNGARQPDLIKSDSTYWNRLYRNTGDFHFEDVTERAGLRGEGYSMGAAAADFDGDGFTDLFVTGVDRNLLYRNVGGRSFERVAFPSTGWSISAGWFDYDRDGDLDLFIVNYVKWNPAAEPFCGDAKAGYRTYCHPKYYEGLANSLFRNDGGGKFTDVSGPAGIAAHTGKGMAVSFADSDGDGWLDAAVTNDTTPNFLFRNRRDGTFAEVGMEAGIGRNDDGRALSSMGLDFRDIDNDGRPDLFITALANETFPLYRGLARGLFLDVTYPSMIGAATIPYSGWSAGMYDFDHDGNKDILIANGDVNDNTERFSSRRSRQQNLLLWNEGRRFRAEALGEAAQYRGAAFGDLDGDGDIDAVLTRLGEKPVIWRNERPPAGRHWIAIRSSLGAQVHIRAGGREQWNMVTQAVGYASSSQPVAHFGLGAAATAEEVTVVWPDGRRKVFPNAAADRYLPAP